MFFFGFNGCGMSKVYLHPFAHNQLAIEDLLDFDTGFLIKEGDDYAAKTLEWCPRMNRCRGIDKLFDILYVVGTENERVVKVGDEESV